MADLFAVDIIYGILSRLPVKSLARFRCVCKLWLKYINDPYLHTIHVEEEPTPIIFEQFARVDPKKIKISFLRGAQKDPVLELCYKPDDYYWRLLLGSCNGVVLVSLEQDPSDAGIYRFALINPLTKERRDLPPISIKIRDSHIDLEGPCHAAGIGFDDSTNNLKTVFVILKNPDTNVVCTMVHDSCSWRKIAQMPAYAIAGEGVFGGRLGRLHWLTDCIYNNSPVKIVWFDLKTEEYGLMDPPESIQFHLHSFDVNGEDVMAYNELVDLNGEVGFAYCSPICIKLWILNQQEEWVLHSWIDLPRYNFDWLFVVGVSGCWNKNGDLLLTCDNNSGERRLFVYTLKTGDLQQVEQPDGDPLQGYIRMHLSSLFSINHTFHAAATNTTHTKRRIPFAKSVQRAAARTRPKRTKRTVARLRSNGRVQRI